MTPRLRLSIPDSKPLFITKIPARITDLNYGNHLGNDAVVSILHESRVQFLYQNDMTELDAGGTGLIMANLTVNYKNQSYYGDVLNIEIFTNIISQISFEFIYRITTLRESKSIIIAIAGTTMASYNYTESKVAKLSPQLLKALKKEKI